MVLTLKVHISTLKVHITSNVDFSTVHISSF